MTAPFLKSDSRKSGATHESGAVTFRFLVWLSLLSLGVLVSVSRFQSGDLLGGLRGLLRAVLQVL